MALELKMKPWGSSPKGRSQWRLGTVDHSEVLFPDSKLLRKLFRRHSPATGELQVIFRRPNCLVVEIPAGTTPPGREPFVRAVEQEVVPKR